MLFFMRLFLSYEFWEGHDLKGAGNRWRPDTFLFLSLQIQPVWFRETALVPYTASEWCDIGARLWDMVCQRGETQVQITFINGTEMSDETLTVAPSSTGLCLILGNITKPWEDSSLIGHIANLRAFQLPNFENQLILPIVGAARELGRVARTDHC
ncbi:hypothetical protein TcYC6_0015930 [Trypanosoma cruzi]|nr:hypothetical protein TcYC6_0015930 [Trypanosoma cruzi]